MSDKIEKAKIFIGELDSLMKKHGMEEMIVITIVENSLLPIFVQDDPKKENPNREFLQKFYVRLTQLFSGGASGFDWHTKEPQRDWDCEKLI